MFPSEASASGHLESIQHFNARIGEAGGAKFWFHALRNCSITVADRELMLLTSLTKRLVNHAPSQDITEGYAADWTMEQPRDAAQRIADRIAELTLGTGPAYETASQTASRRLRATPPHRDGGCSGSGCGNPPGESPRAPPVRYSGASGLACDNHQVGDKGECLSLKSYCRSRGGSAYTNLH